MTAAQGRDPVLERVRRAADPEIVAGRGAEQAFNVEGQDALAEERHWRLSGRRAGIGSHDDVVHPRAAVPFRLEAAGAEQLPAVAVGDVEGQASIGEGLRRLVHPCAPLRRRPDARPPSRIDVAGQVKRGVGLRLHAPN